MSSPQIRRKAVAPDPTVDAQAPTRRSRGLTDRTLKVIGLVLVILSALGTAVVQKGLPDDASQADFSQLTMAVLLEVVSWIAFPIYAWLLYMGYARTRNRRRYALRLAVLAIVSEVPYDLATRGGFWDTSSQNPVFALLVALAVFYLLDRVRRRGGAASIVLSVVIVAAGLVWLVFFNVYLRFSLIPGGALILLFAVIFYYLHQRENAMALTAGVLGALAGVFPAMGMVVLHFRSENRGVKGEGEKYAFYALYPICLLAVGLYGLMV